MPGCSLTCELRSEHDSNHKSDQDGRTVEPLHSEHGALIALYDLLMDLGFLHTRTKLISHPGLFFHRSHARPEMARCVQQLNNCPTIRLKELRSCSDTVVADQTCFSSCSSSDHAA